MKSGIQTGAEAVDVVDRAMAIVVSENIVYKQKPAKLNGVRVI